MRPPVSSAASLPATPDAGSGDSDLVWLELDEIDTEWKEVRDLPTDVVQIIRATASHLEELDPYSLIGVEQDAEWTEIERAYRKRLATFHPHRWNGYHLADLRPSMEAVSQRISHAFAFLAEEAAREGTLATPAETSVDRPTRPVELDAIDLDFSGERPTFPSSGALSIATVADDPPRARPPRPPPRKTA